MTATNLPSTTYEVHGDGSQERRRRCRVFEPIAQRFNAVRYVCMIHGDTALRI
jgi:hypothetical protein